MRLATFFLWGPLPILSVLSAPAYGAIEGQRSSASPNERLQEPEPMVLTKAPELVQFFNAPYPEELLSEGLAGEVVLHIDIGEDGLVDAAEIVSTSHPSFAEPALVACSQFVFSPAEINNAVAAIRIEYRYMFEPELPEPDAVAGAHAVAPPTGNDAPVNFAGLVREAGNRRPLANVVVTINGRPVAETDSEGRFSIRGTPVGDFNVKLSTATHQDYDVRESRSETEKLEARYYLLPGSSNPFETVVRSRADRREVSKIQLQRHELQKVPGTFGDPVRVIENLPGLARTPGGLGGALLVRGARPSDSRVFYDGVEVPILFHFGGLTSVVNSEFLERIDFYPGGFGARYGRATAGIVEITTRDLDCDVIRGVGKIDVIDSSLFGCAPVGSWYVAAAGRRSYIDAILPGVVNALTPEDGASLTVSPVYWDYQAKAHGRFGNHSFDLFVFGSDDRLRLIQAGSAEDIDVTLNFGTTFHRFMGKHRYKLDDRLSITTTLAPGLTYRGFDLTASGSTSDAGVQVFSLDWREDISFKVNDRLTLNAGLDHLFGRADFNLQFPVPTELRRFPSATFDYTQVQALDLRLNEFGQGYWVEVVADLPGGLRLVPGLRFDRFHFSSTRDFAVQPRLTARWDLLESTTLKGAYGIYEKLPEPNFLIDNIGNPRLSPERAQHFILGVEQAFTDLISLDLQAFYILRDRLAVGSQAVSYVNGQARPELWASVGKGRSYGLEVMLRHLATPDGWFYGWIAYTLSRSFVQEHQPGSTYSVQPATGSARQTPYSDRATAEYAAQFDQPHILTVVGQFMLPWGLEAGLRFRLVSGNPTTFQDRGQVSFDGDTNSYRNDLTDVPRSSDRFPTFHQLDVRIDKTFTFDLWKLSVYLEVLNVYYARNVESFQYDYRFRERLPITFLPILPVLGIQGEF